MRHRAWGRVFGDRYKAVVEGVLDRGVLRMAGGEAENAERRERESDVEKNRMEEPLEVLPVLPVLVAAH